MLYLGIWRYYTHAIDDGIVGLYGDFLDCESTMNVLGHGTSGYLFRKLGRIDAFNKLSREKKVLVIKELVRRKRIGRRGHLKWDMGVAIVNALLTLVFLAVVVPYAISDCNRTSIIGVTLASLAILTGLVLTFKSLFCFHWKPREKDVTEALARFHIRMTSTSSHDNQ